MDCFPKAKSSTFHVLFFYFTTTTIFFLLRFYDNSTFSYNIPVNDSTQMKTMQEQVAVNLVRSSNQRDLRTGIERQDTGADLLMPQCTQLPVCAHVVYIFY